MTTRETWLALAERCEKATGPDREIDESILRKIGYDYDAVADFRWAWLDRRGCIVASTIPLTNSLDDIVRLIRDDLTEYGWLIRCGHKFITAQIWPYGQCDGHSFAVDAPTPALALCAAFCRAMAEKENANA